MTDESALAITTDEQDARGKKTAQLRELRLAKHADAAKSLRPEQLNAENDG